ncbi:hypothetical protein LZF95_22825 [Algoriphagus sp. AGSA1]|uniref:hypothetical protein n=1 Tax=Algoriphagus sp. AGSA1 TaxID=2907213 RepID=UPI001F26859A|nr:hypothetical protein [Algoriphagus sp. AGSA1]MCE7057533.1 hypothetical protein [Algoriphagus sp. AGSA1]
MNKCKLCKSSNAVKKGSHIIPHFLLKKIENIDGSKLRDMELGFTLTATDSKVHFGRAVPPEKLEKVLGKIEESDIENNNHPMILDYIFCSNCEIRFSNIESIYSIGLSKPINSNNESGNSGVISILFWVSVFWRLSIIYPKIFSKKEIEFMRKSLDRFLTSNGEEINEKGIIESHTFEKIGLRILKSVLNDTDASHHMIHPRFKYPYSMIIHDMVITLAFSNNFSIYKNSNLFGLSNEILESSPTLPSGNEKLNPLDSSILRSMNLEVVNTSVRQRVKSFNSILNEIHVRLGGRGNTMPTDIKSLIWSHMANKENEKAKQFTLEDFYDSVIEVFKNHIIE